MYDTLIRILCEFKVNHNNIPGFAFGFAFGFCFLGVFYVFVFLFVCLVLFLLKFTTVTLLLGRLYSFCIKDKLLLFLPMLVCHKYVTTHDRS